MTRSINIPDKATSGTAHLINKLRESLPDKGYFALILVMILLSGLASYESAPNAHIFLAGDIAPIDITADRTLLFEDPEATLRKQEEARQSQPLVCDLFLAPIGELHDSLLQIIALINKTPHKEVDEELLASISQISGVETYPETVAILAKPEIQMAILETLLPLVQKYLAQGVLPEMRQTLSFRSGIVARNLSTGEEQLHPNIDRIFTMKSLDDYLDQQITKMPGSAMQKRVLSQLISSLLQPTLLPNFSVTLERTDVVVAAVAPVLHRMDKGEIIVRQGEKVTLDQQLKIQTLWNNTASPFNATLFAGAVILGVLLSSGLLFSPSGKRGSSITQRDFIFIASLVLVFSLMGKGLHTLGLNIGEVSPSFSAEYLAYAMPVVGASSLASLIFSTRRYLVTGLLLAFFCTLMAKGGTGLFLFYFLSAMWGTWVTTHTQSRQDVVWSFFPILLGLLCMWLGSALLDATSLQGFLPEAVAVVTGAMLSILLTIALAPIVEMVFGYTTRFRLMELLNMEQPLLRELMINAPGTYHHSLIVSNMVEAGAEAIGANSLLCKVAALYHDVGKSSKAHYFIENQFTEDNPHDRLTPSMSALILISHVKQGVEMAEQHRLGKEVVDIIEQHHGNGLIRFFYHKAMRLQNGVAPQVEDFCYPGPKPQSKEAALVMLADVVEASSRTIHDPTPTKLRQHIDTIIKAFYADGQLDEADLTFKDLDTLADSFQRILRGIFHQRIAYPEKLAKNAPSAMEKKDGKEIQAPLEDESASFIGESPSNLPQ